MAFNKVQTQAEAKAFNYLQDQSTVLRTKETNEINVNAINVITKTPEAGDVLCVTKKTDGTSLLPSTQQEIVWIKGDSVNYAHWPSANGNFIYEPVGVCYKVRGGKAYCRYRSEVSRRWLEADRFLVTNTAAIMALTGSLTLSVYAASGCGSSDSPLTTTVDFTSGQTLHERCSIIQTALASFGDNTTVSCQYAGPHDYDAMNQYGSYDGDDGVMILNGRFTAYAWNEVHLTIGDVTASISRCNGRDIPADSTNYRRNGGQVYWGGGNFNKFYDYYHTNGREYAESDPAPTNHIETGSPLKETAFASNPQAAIYRKAYGTYKNYLRSCMVEWPTNKGANGRFFDKGIEYTEKLAKAVYIDMSRNSSGGTRSAGQGGYVTYLYGPAHYCNVEVSVNGPGMTQGNWHLPSSGELIEFIQDVTYGTSAYSQDTTYPTSDIRRYVTPSLDPVNRAIYRLNNNTFDASQGWKFTVLSAGDYRWSSSRSGVDYAYSYDGGSGSIYDHYMYDLFYAAPCAVFVV